MFEGWRKKVEKVDEEGVIHTDVPPAAMTEQGVVVQPGASVAEVKAKIRETAEQWRDAA